MSVLVSGPFPASQAGSCNAHGTSGPGSSDKVFTIALQTPGGGLTLRLRRACATTLRIELRKAGAA